MKQSGRTCIMQTSFTRERVGTYRQRAACELSAALRDAGEKCTQPRALLGTRTAGSISLFADPSRLYRSSAFLLHPSWALGVPALMANIALLKCIDCGRTRSAALAQVIDMLAC